jgi:hypothetical protein
MSRTTLGKNWPKDAPRGDYRAVCDSCGIPWQKSKMRRSYRNRLLCPDCYEPRDEFVIEQENINIRNRARSIEQAVSEYARR